MPGSFYKSIYVVITNSFLLMNSFWFFCVHEHVCRGQKTIPSIFFRNAVHKVFLGGKVSHWTGTHQTG